MENQANYREMTLEQLARVCYRDWGAKIYFAARPYLLAMTTLNSVDDAYGYDTGRGIVNYFLNNAKTWRGPVARDVKAELKRRVR